MTTALAAIASGLADKVLNGGQIWDGEHVTGAEL
jgi:hypothetical protein